MALLTSLRFTSRMGAMAIDQESWFLRRRKTFFTDYLYPLIPVELAEMGLELYYGGIGHPSFHYEVVSNARQAIAQKYVNVDKCADTLFTARPAYDLGREVLYAFQKTMQKRIDDRLQFLYGFSRQDFIQKNAPQERGQNNSTPVVNQSVVKSRALNIIEGKESLGYGALTVANEACVIGIDPKNGFSGFTLKEEDGVLSFHSCGFDALGSGKYIAGSEFADLLNQLSLKQRRSGMGLIHGLTQLGKAHIKASNTFGQVGGTIRIIILDADGRTRALRRVEIAHNKALLFTEMLKGYLAGLLTEKILQSLIHDLLAGLSLDVVEDKFFRSISDFHLLEKMVRGYKIGLSDLPQASEFKKMYTN
ncbi:hypothetical protein ACFL27_23025 [candidate division CSSED10-310 bacterium]|uniref:Uncharacterized protein n=1 Tax=candidate division CSSED10-310 bacterium TaxID=2855610 RepID=A0ABV6Z402_UNCC1